MRKQLEVFLPYDLTEAIITALCFAAVVGGLAGIPVIFGADAGIVLCLSTAVSSYLWMIWKIREMNWRLEWQNPIRHLTVPSSSFSFAMAVLGTATFLHPILLTTGGFRLAPAPILIGVIGFALAVYLKREDEGLRWVIPAVIAGTIVQSVSFAPDWALWLWFGLGLAVLILNWYIMSERFCSPRQEIGE